MGIRRRTKSIDLLLEQFEKERGAISATVLTERLHEQVNKTTIYRSLERLEDEGLIHSFVGRNAIKWYAKCNGCSTHGHNDIHPHFQCLSCGKMECLPIEVTIPKIKDREVHSSRILIQGKCDKCLS